MIDVIKAFASYEPAGGNVSGYLWLFAALILLLLEIGTPGLFFFVAFAVGACCGSIAAFMQATLFAQCIIALVGSLVALLVFKKLFFTHQSGSGVRTNMQALIGARGLVTRTIEFEKTGRVKINSEQWPARCHRSTVLPAGTRVKVICVAGNKVIVQAINELPKKE